MAYVRLRVRPCVIGSSMLLWPEQIQTSPYVTSERVAEALPLQPLHAACDHHFGRI